MTYTDCKQYATERCGGCDVCLFGQGYEDPPAGWKRNNMTNEDKIKTFDRLMALLDHHALDGVTISKCLYNREKCFVDLHTIDGKSLELVTDPLPVALAVAYEKVEEYVRERDGDDE